MIRGDPESGGIPPIRAARFETQKDPSAPWRVGLEHFSNLP